MGPLRDWVKSWNSSIYGQTLQSCSLKSEKKTWCVCMSSHSTAAVTKTRKKKTRYRGSDQTAGVGVFNRSHSGTRVQWSAAFASENYGSVKTENLMIEFNCLQRAQVTAGGAGCLQSKVQRAGELREQCRHSRWTVKTPAVAKSSIFGFLPTAALLHFLNKF